MGIRGTPPLADDRSAPVAVRVRACTLTGGPVVAGPVDQPSRRAWPAVSPGDIAKKPPPSPRRSRRRTRGRREETCRIPEHRSSYRSSPRPPLALSRFAVSLAPSSAALSYSPRHRRSFFFRRSPRSPFRTRRYLRRAVGGEAKNSFINYAAAVFCVHAGDPMYTQAEQWKSRESRILDDDNLLLCAQVMVVCVYIFVYMVYTI